MAENKKFSNKTVNFVCHPIKAINIHICRIQFSRAKVEILHLRLCSNLSIAIIFITLFQPFRFCLSRFKHLKLNTFDCLTQFAHSNNFIDNVNCSTIARAKTLTFATFLSPLECAARVHEIIDNTNSCRRFHFTTLCDFHNFWA